MRERVARTLLIIFLMLIIAIDISSYVTEISSAPMNYIESFVDLIAVALIYILLKRELNFRKRVLNMVAHDLRNPLGMIQGYAEVILDHDLDADRKMEMVQRIQIKSEEVLQLVNDLLDSKIFELNRIQIHSQKTDLLDVIRQAVRDFEGLARKKEQQLSVDCRAQFFARIDASRVRQALGNVIGNAIKYSPKGSKIEIVLEKRTATKAVISVKDQGPGLNKSECKKVFETFSKVKKRPTDGEGSIGIGLSIAKNLIELNGGKIWAESSGEGCGSTFRIEFEIDL